MTTGRLRALKLSCLKVASPWLTTRPLEAKNFTLTQREFFGAVRLRYRWNLEYLPQICPCNKQYMVDHAMQCPKGGFLLQRYDDVKDYPLLRLMHPRYQNLYSAQCETSQILRFEVARNFFCNRFFSYQTSGSPCEQILQSQQPFMLLSFDAREGNDAIIGPLYVPIQIPTNLSELYWLAYMTEF